MPVLQVIGVHVARATERIERRQRFRRPRRRDQIVGVQKSYELGLYVCKPAIARPARPAPVLIHNHDMLALDRLRQHLSAHRVDQVGMVRPDSRHHRNQIRRPISCGCFAPFD